LFIYERDTARLLRQNSHEGSIPFERLAARVASRDANVLKAMRIALLSRSGEGTTPLGCPGGAGRYGLGSCNVSRVAQEIDDLVRGVCRTAGAIDDVLDGADTAQGNGDEIVELNPRSIGDLEGIGSDDARVDVEEAVGPQPPPLVGPDVVGHLVGCEAIDAVMRPSELSWRVVGHLVLEHDRGPVLAVPDDLVALVVLDKKAVGGDVIPVDDQAVRSGVARPAQTGAALILSTASVGWAMKKLVIRIDEPAAGPFPQLLLRGVDDETVEPRGAAAADQRVGEEAATGEPALVGEQEQRASDVDPPQRSGLRHRPLVDRRATVVRGGNGVHGQVLGRPPEVDQRGEAPVGLQLSLDSHLAVDGHVVGR